MPQTSSRYSDSGKLADTADYYKGKDRNRDKMSVESRGDYAGLCYRSDL